MRRQGTIWLVGMMGAGKSAVGQALARLLGTEFVDTDLDVERRAGSSIAELFAAQGEAAFRALEREAVERAAGKPLVAALGGGAVAQPGLLARLQETGTLVYLCAQPGTLLARLGDAAERPLLRGLDPAERARRIEAMLAEREPYYARAALRVDTDARSVEQVAEAVRCGLEPAR